MEKKMFKDCCVRVCNYDVPSPFSPSLPSLLLLLLLPSGGIAGNIGKTYGGLYTDRRRRRRRPPTNISRERRKGRKRRKESTWKDVDAGVTWKYHVLTQQPEGKRNRKREGGCRHRDELSQVRKWKKGTRQVGARERARADWAISFRK